MSPCVLNFCHQNRAVKDAEGGLDLENRAYYMTISIQRWLTVRLDLMGNVLVLGIALFAAGFRHTINPAKIGVVLSYTLSSKYCRAYQDGASWLTVDSLVTQIFCKFSKIFFFFWFWCCLYLLIIAQMVSQFAQNEQNMNAVERVLHYTELPAEGDFTTPDDPPPTWPMKGKITFSNVKMSYREGLPLVLKDVSFEINPGEKVHWNEVSSIEYDTYINGLVLSGWHRRANGGRQKFPFTSDVSVCYILCSPRFLF